MPDTVLNQHKEDPDHALLCPKLRSVNVQFGPCVRRSDAMGIKVKRAGRGGAMVQLVRCFPCKHEDLSPTHKNQPEKLIILGAHEPAWPAQ